MLSLRTQPATARAQARSAPSRRLCVVPKAFSLQEWTSSIANGFVRIFSKPETNVSQYAENNFSGKIAHHERGRKPFADGYAASASAVKAALAADEAATAAKEDYLQGAVNRVANHQFKGDSTEPKSFGGNDGFKGDIHGKGADRDGFHSKVR